MYNNTTLPPFTSLKPSNSKNNTGVVYYGQLFKIMVFSAYVITFLVGAVGNILVCHVILSRKQKRRSIHLLTLNLAISDLIVSIIYLPMQIYMLNTNLSWYLGDISCRVFFGINSLTVNASIGTLVVITYDRYNAVVKPMVVHSRNTTATKVLIVVVWVVSLFITFPLLLVATVENNYCSESWPNPDQERGYWIFAFVAQFVLPLFYISATYIMIIYAVKTSHNQFELVKLHNDLTKNQINVRGKTNSKNTNNDNNNSIEATMLPKIKRSNNRTNNRNITQSRGKMKRKKQQNKLLKMSITLVIAYGICVSPQHAVFFAGTYGDFANKSYASMVFILANFLMAFNSALNPVIYGTLNDEMKKSIKRMFSSQSSSKLSRNVSSIFSSLQHTVRRRFKLRSNTECSLAESVNFDTSKVTRPSTF